MGDYAHHWSWPATKVDEQIDKVIETVLLGLLAFAPLTFGAVEAWSGLILTTAVIITAGLLQFKLIISPRARFEWSWTYWPMGLFVGLICLQLVPLPPSVVSTLSPDTVAIKSAFLSDLPGDSEHEWMTLSLYPHATARQVRLVLLAIAMYVVAINVYRQQERMRRCLVGIAAIGGVFGLLALLQDITGTDRIYWMFESAHQSAGPFANYSHYSQFMVLSMGAALALLLTGSWSQEPRHPRQGQRVRQISLLTGALAATIVVGLVTITWSMSRAGVISAVIAGCFTLAVVSRTRGMTGRGWLLITFAAVAFSMLLVFGFDIVYDRLATLQSNDGGRWQILKDIGAAWPQFAVWGTGLGTFEVRYPMIERSGDAVLSQFAENEYAQMFVETGCVGLVLILAFVCGVWRSYYVALRNSPGWIRAMTLGLGYGLCAAMVHSFSDFGQHVPGIAMLSAVTCGLVISAAKRSTSSRQGPEDTAERRTTSGRRFIARVAQVVAAILFVGVAACIWVSMNNERLAENHWNRALALETKIEKNNWEATDDEYLDLIHSALKAASYQPGNVHYQYWLNVYRWQSIYFMDELENGEKVFSPEMIEFGPRIVDEFNVARRMCPTFGPAHCLAGQIQLFVLGQEEGAQLIRNGYRLAPNDPTVCFVFGLLAVREGRWDDSLRLFRASGARYRQESLQVYLEHEHRTDLAISLVSEDAGPLLALAQRLDDMEGQSDWAEKARNQARSILESRHGAADRTAWEHAALASIYRDEGNLDGAIECYRQALVAEYANVHWHLALARLLADTGDVTKARREALICLRLRPNWRPALRFLENLR